MKTFVIETKKADVKTYLDGVLESTYTLVTQIITPNTSYLKAITGIQHIEIDPENTVNIHYADSSIETVKKPDFKPQDYDNFLTMVSYLQT